MSAASEEANHVVASTPGIGYRLQQARERKKLTIADAATQLRFTRATVINLEQEEWDKLHSRIYARGYLLSYAKFLGLPSDDMLSAFNAQYGDTERERPSTLLKSKTLPVEKPFPWLSSLLIVMVLIIAVLAIQFWPQQDAELAQNTDNSIASSPPQAAPEPELLDADINIRPNPANAEDARDVSKLDDIPAAPLIIESMPAEMADSEQQNLTEPAPEKADVNDAGADVAASDDDTEQAVATPASGDAELTLVITEASWVEVKDNDGNTLISRVLEQETIDLKGPAPLAVRIGNVAGTALRFNGQDVDLDNYRQNNVARLTLGAES